MPVLIALGFAILFLVTERDAVSKPTPSSPLHVCSRAATNADSVARRQVATGPFENAGPILEVEPRD